MPAGSSRLSDTFVLSAMADPLTGLTNSEIAPAMPTPQNNIVIDTGLVELPASRVKSLAIVVTTGLTWVTSGQATVQLFAARTRYGVLGGDTASTVWGASGGVNMPTTPFNGSSAATSGFPTGNVPNACQFVGTTANLGSAASTALAANIYWFSPAGLAELQWWYPVMGVEVKFPSALTAGVFAVFFEVAPI